MSEFARLLLQHLDGRYAIDGTQIEILEAHLRLMTAWNRRTNLTALYDLEEIVVRHYCESIAFAYALPFGKLQIMDAGSGAGFPGIPLAVIRRESFVRLVEADMKKAIFLREATLSFVNCRVLRQRLEEVSQEADWIVSRAVRWELVVKAAERLSDHVGLMVSDDTAREIRATPWWRWEDPVPSPWGNRLVFQFGHRPGREKLQEECPNI